MPEVDRLNVKIEADASSLKKETKESIKVLEELQAKFNEVSRTLSEAFSKNGSPDYISSLTETRNELKRLMDDLKAGTIGPNDIAIQRALGHLDTAPIENVKEEVKEVDNNLKEVHDTQNKINLNWDTSGLKRLQSAVKKIATSIIGITSVFGLIRKSVSTYLSQNDALRKKIEGIYYAIGSLFAPILEWIVNLFAKIVLYVNAFLKGLGLSGIQFKNIQSSAQKTQKTMRTLISGFDELNTLQKKGEESDNTLTDPFADVKVNQEWIDKLTKLGEKLRPIFEWIRETLKNIFDWVIDHIGLVIGALVAIKAIGLIAKVVELWGHLKNIFDAVKAFVSASGLGGILKTIGGIGLIIGGLILSVTQFVDMWKNGWNIIGEILKDLGIALVAIGAIILGAPAAVAGIVAGIAAVLSTLVIVVHEHWDEIVAWTKDLWAKLVQVWEQIKTSASEIWNKICAVIIDIVTKFKEGLHIVWEDIKQLCIDQWNSIKEFANKIWNALKDDVIWIVQVLGQKLGNLWTGIKNVVSGIMNNIKSFITNAWNSIKNTVISINNAIGNAVRNIWNGITSVIRGAVNGIIGFVNGMIRSVTGGINAVIGVLNQFSVDIPDWVPLLGGRHFGFNLRTISAPQIPTLARGGVLKEPTLAMLGEYANANNNPEIAAPQSMLQEMFDANNANLIASFAQMTSQIISAIEGVDLEVSIGDETIARSAARGNNSYRNMTGRSLITV